MDESGLTERHVQAIWYDRDLRPENLSTTDGEAVRVVHPGEWNRVAGPDFRGAVLEVGTRRRLVGDVEIHLSPSDWDAHGHGGNRGYRNVIAHVTWHGGAPPPSLPQGAVSICLGQYFVSDVGFSPDSIDLGAYPFGKLPAVERPCRRSAYDSEAARCLLSRTGKWRLRAKAERMASLLKTEDYRQVFYAEMMNALGYAWNSMGFRAVAAAVPYSVMCREPENVSAAFLSAATFVEWNRHRVRPNNAPEVRLQSAARLFVETNALALSKADDVSREACGHMMEVLTEGRHVGRGRAAAMLANVIVPFALARGQVHDVPDWLPPEDVCAPVRRVAYRMFGGDHNPSAWYSTNGLFIQGLIQIDREWCARFHPACVGCEMED